jgi:uncharacterized short protein YbdD (DUF466 family)
MASSHENLSATLKRVGSVVRRVIGAPDYERYLQHMREHHPGTQPLTAAEFERERTENRYNKPGTRCC